MNDLPNIAFQKASEYLIASTPEEPPILIFLDGQYVFRYHEAGRIFWKSISSSAVQAAFSKQPIDSGWLPTNTMRCGLSASGKWAVQFHMKGKYSLLLHTEDNSLQEIKVPLPSLVFLGINQKYYIWAIAEKEFSPDAKIYHAPLPNISSTGEICFGNNMPTGDVEKDWQLFLETAFNNHNINHKSRRYPQDIRMMLLNLAHKNTHKYPCGDLEPVNGGMTSIGTKIDSVVKNP